MPYHMRPMRQEDINQVNEIDREAFPSQWPPPNYQHELHNQLASYSVACDESRTIEEPAAKPGMLSRLASRVWRRLDHDRQPPAEPPPRVREYLAGFAGIWVLADEAHITNIAVRQSYQRQGLGELLMLKVIEMARELKADVVTLEVRASNTAAQNLYSKYGFAQVGLRRGYYIDNREDAILMTTPSINSDSFQAKLEQLRRALNSKPVYASAE